MAEKHGLGITGLTAAANPPSAQPIPASQMAGHGLGQARAEDGAAASPSTRPPAGEAGSLLDLAIRWLQEAFGYKVDGVVEAGGPTEGLMDWLFSPPIVANIMDPSVVGGPAKPPPPGPFMTPNGIRYPENGHLDANGVFVPDPAPNAFKLRVNTPHGEQKLTLDEYAIHYLGRPVRWPTLPPPQHTPRPAPPAPVPRRTRRALSGGTSSTPPKQRRVRGAGPRNVQYTHPSHQNYERRFDVVLEEELASENGFLVPQATGTVNEDGDAILGTGVEGKYDAAPWTQKTFDPGVMPGESAQAASGNDGLREMTQTALMRQHMHQIPIEKLRPALEQVLRKEQYGLDEKEITTLLKGLDDFHAKERKARNGIPFGVFVRLHWQTFKKLLETPNAP